MNGYNFTERVRRVLQTAREEAMALQHEYVGTEHILLGLCTDDGIAAATLTDLGLDLQQVRDNVLDVVKRGSLPVPGPDLPYTSRAKKSLEHAVSEARALSHAYVGTEHLLLGILLEGKNIAAQVLTAQGATVDRVRREVLRLLGGDASGTPPVPGSATTVPERTVAITVIVERGGGRMEARKFRSPEDAARFLSHLDRS